MEDAITIDDLSPLLRDLAEQIGLEDALRFLRAFPGRAVNVPTKLEEDHFLIDRLGVELAGRILDIYGGQYVQVPRGSLVQRNLAKRQAYKDWLSGQYTYSDLAERYEVHVRTIYNWVREWESHQPRLASTPQTPCQQLVLFAD